LTCNTNLLLVPYLDFPKESQFLCPFPLQDLHARLRLLQQDLEAQTAVLQDTSSQAEALRTENTELLASNSVLEQASQQLHALQAVGLLGHILHTSSLYLVLPQVTLPCSSFVCLDFSSLFASTFGGMQELKEGAAALEAKAAEAIAHSAAGAAAHARALELEAAVAGLEGFQRQLQDRCGCMYLCLSVPYNA